MLFNSRCYLLLIFKSVNLLHENQSILTNMGLELDY